MEKWPYEDMVYSPRDVSGKRKSNMKKLEDLNVFKLSHSVISKLVWFRWGIEADHTELARAFAMKY